MKLLLHCCCAPCSVSCVKMLREEKIEPEIFFFNPNIHPFTEYRERRECIKKFADNENLKLAYAEEEYGLREFLKEITSTLNEHPAKFSETHIMGFPAAHLTEFPTIQSQRAARCEKCYRMRIEKTAAFAAENSFTAFTTTLLISPYQNHDAIKKTAQEAAEKYGIDFLYRDFRPLFREGQAISRESGFYMQKYCGCVFSEEERYLIEKKELKSEGAQDSQTRSTDGLKIYSQNSSSASSNPCENIFNRISLLIGNDNLEKLKKTSVLVFGAGGVGSWAAEALARSGIGRIGIIDNDIVCPSNINRQAEATTLTLGKFKASCLKARLLEINPECQVTSYNKIFSRENENNFDIDKTDYVIDAIDSLNHKLDLIEKAAASNTTLFSSMGMALKLDSSLIKASSIWKTEGCSLARLVRQGLRKRKFTGDFTAVYSSEEVIHSSPYETNSGKESRTIKSEVSGAENTNNVFPASMQNNDSFDNFLGNNKKRVNGSIVTVTGAAGLLLAGLVIRHAINK